MKKLVKWLNDFAETSQIELNTWTRELLYAFIKELTEGIRDGKT